MVVVEVLDTRQEQRKVVYVRRIYSQPTLQLEGSLRALSINSVPRLGGCADSSKQHPAATVLLVRKFQPLPLDQEKEEQTHEGHLALTTTRSDHR